MIYYNKLTKENYTSTLSKAVSHTFIDITNIIPIVRYWHLHPYTYGLIGTEGNDAFNQPIGGWDTSNFDSLLAMLRGLSDFNQPIGDWDVSNVVNFYNMFTHAHSFDQDISTWIIKDIANIESMFKDCPIRDEYKPKEVT